MDLTLSACEGGYQVAARLDEPGRGEACPISQDPMAEYDLEFLPGVTWSERHPTYRRLTLPCSHAFSAMAVTYHFAKNGMQCPLCRTGEGVPMAPACLPRHFRESVLLRLEAERARERDEEERANLAEVLLLVREEVIGNPQTFSMFMRAHRITLTVYAYDIGDSFMPAGVCEYPLEVSATGDAGDLLCASLPRASVRALTTNLRMLGRPSGYVFVVGTRSLEGAVVLLDRSPYTELVEGAVKGLTDLAGFEVGLLESGGRRDIASLKWILKEEHFLLLARARVMSPAFSVEV